MLRVEFLVIIYLCDKVKPRPVSNKDKLIFRGNKSQITDLDERATIIHIMYEVRMERARSQEGEFFTEIFTKRRYSCIESKTSIEIKKLGFSRSPAFFNLALS